MVDQERAEHVMEGIEIQRAERHADELILKVGYDMKRKYMRGQQEHGGDLKDRNLIRDVMMEALDLAVYSYTLQEQLQEIADELKEIKKMDSWMKNERIDGVIAKLSKYSTPDVV